MQRSRFISTHLAISSGIRDQEDIVLIGLVLLEPSLRVMEGLPTLSEEMARQVEALFKQSEFSEERFPFPRLVPFFHQI